MWKNLRLLTVYNYLNANKSIRLLSNQQTSQFNIFDRKTKLKQREYSLKLKDNHVFDYLKSEIGYRLFDSLLDIKRLIIVNL